MGLFDWFRRARDSGPDPLRDVYARLGAVAVELETLKGRQEAQRDEWIVMRDELRRLAQRLEKRDQRAAEKVAAAQEEGDEDALRLERDGQPIEVNAFPRGFNELEAQRALRERKRHRGH